jgi:pilus assembly protein CpaE
MTHILIADDHAPTRILMRRRLEAVGFQVTEAEDGQSALSSMNEVKPEVILLDMMMPVMDGATALRDIRSRPQIADTIVIIISAQDQIGKSLSRDEGGPDAYLLKPVNFQELLSVISKLLHDRTATAPGPAKSANGAAANPLSSAGGNTGAGIVAIVGAKGGVGVTTVAVNCGVALAKARRPVLMLETANFHGTAAIELGLQSKRRLDQLGQGKRAIDRDSVAEIVTTHSSGLKVILGSAANQPPPAADGVIELMDAAKQISPTVIVDLSTAMDVYGQVILRVANRILIVTAPEPASVDRAVALVAMIGQWGVSRSSISLVVNQIHAGMLLDTAEIESRAGVSVAMRFPSCPDEAYASTLSGNPIVSEFPLSSTSRQYAELAGSLLGVATGMEQR